MNLAQQNAPIVDEDVEQQEEQHFHQQEEATLPILTNLKRSSLFTQSL